MTIHDPKKFCDGLWDWGCLNGCFGSTNIRPTDIDGFVERNGRFLVLETKHPNVEIPYGQRLTFERLTKTGCFAVILIWGNANKPERITIIRPKGTDIVYENASIDTLRMIVKSWFQWANQTPALKFEDD